MSKALAGVAAALLTAVLAASPVVADNEIDEARAVLFAKAATALAAAREANAALLAPGSFEDGTKAYERAENDYERGRSLERIRRYLDEAAQAFAEAARAAGIAQRNLSGLMRDRDAAIEAGAEGVNGDSWQDAEQGFRRAALALEKVDAQASLRYAQEASGDYRTAELNAIKKGLLDGTRVLIEQARRDRVQRLAPRTLEQAEALLAEADRALEEDRYDTDRPRDLARQANYQARHAIFLAGFITDLRDTKASTEELILELEEPLRRVASAADIAAEFDEGFEPPAQEMERYIVDLREDARRLEQDLEERTRQVYALEQEVTEVYERLGGVSEERQALARQIERQAMDRQRLTELEALFPKHQAQVLREGDQVIIRLVGLEFQPSSARIPANAQDLLRSLETALRLYPSADITISGHTDSFGGDAANFELSRARAESVRKHLLEVMRLPATRVSAVGHGETRPVASNQTPEGRARNRRIDVAIRPRA